MTKMRKILFLAQLPPPVHGVSAVSQQVCLQLAEMPGVQLFPLWAGGAGSLQDINRKGLKKIGQFAFLLFRLAGQYLAGRRYDFAYLTLAPWTHAALRDGLLAFAARKLAVRPLVHLHGEGLDHVLCDHALKNRLLRWLLKDTELIAITSGAARQAAASGLFRAVHILPNMVPPPRSLPVSRRDAEKSDSDAALVKIGFLGNLDTRKGVKVFVDVFGVLTRVLPPSLMKNIQGVIAGAPTAMMSAEQLEEYIREKKLEDSVRYAGGVYGEEKDAFLQSLDVFLYPSGHDHAPLVLLEAMSCGAVPIVYDTGGIREMLGEELAGNVIDPAHHEETQRHADVLADVIVRYLENRDLLEKDRLLARIRYDNMYTPEQFAARLAVIFELPAGSRELADKNF